MVRLLIHDLMQRRGITADALSRGTDLRYPSAYRLSRPGPLPYTALFAFASTSHLVLASLMPANRPLATHTGSALRCGTRRSEAFQRLLGQARRPLDADATEVGRLLRPAAARVLSTSATLQIEDAAGRQYRRHY